MLFQVIRLLQMVHENNRIIRITYHSVQHFVLGLHLLVYIQCKLCIDGNKDFDINDNIRSKIDHMKMFPFFSIVRTDFKMLT